MPIGIGIGIGRRRQSAQALLGGRIVSSTLTGAAISSASFTPTARKTSTLSGAAVSSASASPTILLDPTKMANLVALWRADKYVAASGTIPDMGPNGYTMTFAVGKPTLNASDSNFNNQASIAFGANQYLTAPNVAFGGSSQYECWAVYKYTGAGAIGVVLFGSTGSIVNSWQLFHAFTTGKGPENFLHGNVGNASWNAPAQSAVKAICAYGDQALSSGNEVGLLQNNVAIGSVNLAVNNTGTFGTQTMFTNTGAGGMTWAETIVFNATLSSAVRTDLFNNYLQPRYNL